MKAPILPAGLDEVTRWYRMPERQKVEDFLGAHPEIVPVLLEARPYLEKQFGPKAVVELRISPRYPTYYEGDPEAPEQLIATALTRLDPDAANHGIDRFFDDWGADAVDMADRLTFDVGYDVSGETLK